MRTAQYAPSVDCFLASGSAEPKPPPYDDAKAVRPRVAVRLHVLSKVMPRY